MYLSTILAKDSDFYDIEVHIDFSCSIRLC